MALAEPFLCFHKRAAVEFKCTANYSTPARWTEPIRHCTGHIRLAYLLRSGHTLSLDLWTCRPDRCAHNSSIGLMNLWAPFFFCTKPSAPALFFISAMATFDYKCARKHKRAHRTYGCIRNTPKYERFVCGQAIHRAKSRRMASGNGNDMALMNLHAEQKQFIQVSSLRATAAVAQKRRKMG